MAAEKRLIDANAYVDELKWVQSQVSSSSAIEIQEYIDRTNRQPTVDAVEVVHGRWGIYRENEISKTVYCSHCWKEFYIRKKGELQLDMMPYCPNCGAKMDGGVDCGL